MARNSVVILPTSASSLSRLMAATEVARSDGIEGIIDTLWNPFECPLEFLPFLAWALSVDVWDNGWPEAVKREVIAASPEVHRRKGTVFAVKRSLEALGVNAVVREWHLQEPVGRRGTFRVEAEFGNGSLEPTPKLNNQVTQFVRGSKPKSRVFEYVAVTSALANLHTAVTSEISFLLESLPPEFEPPEITASVGIAASTEHHFIIEVLAA